MLLHRVTIRIYLVGLAWIQVADTLFRLVHVADDHPEQIVWKE